MMDYFVTPCMDFDQQQDPANQGQSTDPQQQGQTGQSSGQTTDPQALDKQAIKEEVKKFLEATPPPEPRGSAYLNSPECQQFATTVSLPEHPTTFNEKYFLYLFSTSLSLPLGDKKSIIERIPTLSQLQIDEIILVLEEEKQKFDELEHKHPEQVAELRSKATSEWKMLEMEAHKDTAQVDDASKADEIRKQLGL